MFSSRRMVRFAEALDDYENVSVADMGGWGQDGFWVVATDERFGISYEIASHCDYWDFVSAFNWPKVLVPPPYRSEPGAWKEWRRKK